VLNVDILFRRQLPEKKHFDKTQSADRQHDKPTDTSTDNNDCLKLVKILFNAAAITIRWCGPRGGGCSRFVGKLLVLEM